MSRCAMHRINLNMQSLKKKKKKKSNNNKKPQNTPQDKKFFLNQILFKYFAVLFYRNYFAEFTNRI